MSEMGRYLPVTASVIYTSCLEPSRRRGWFSLTNGVRRPSRRMPGRPRRHPHSLLLERGLSWDYGGMPMFVRASLSALTSLDPLAAVLLLAGKAKTRRDADCGHLLQRRGAQCVGRPNGWLSGCRCNRSVSVPCLRAGDCSTSVATEAFS